MKSRRSILAVLAAAPVAAAVPAAARPVVTPYARLTSQLGRLRHRLSIHRRGEDVEVRELRRAVVELSQVVEALIRLDHPSSQEPRRG